MKIIPAGLNPFCHAPTPRSKQGFTLIATLMVVSLLTILVITSAVIIESEQKAQYNASRQEVARQDALFGLDQALNQLQVAAGPDRRTTARADILNSSQNPPPSSVGYGGDQPAIDSGQSFWTGVWTNTSNDFSGSAGNGFVGNPNPAPGNSTGPGPGGSFLYYDCFPSGVSNTTSATTALSSSSYPSRAQLYSNSVSGSTGGNVTWLISWPYNYTPSAPDPTQSLSNLIPSINVPLAASPATPAPLSTPFVALINNLNAKTSANSALTSSTTSVIAPIVPILADKPGTSTSVAVGAYAYYVSDEGIKAKANIADPYLAATATDGSSNGGYLQNQTHFMAALSGDASLALNQNTGGSFNAVSAIDLRSSYPIAPTLASLTYADPASPSSWLDFQNNPNTYSTDFTVESVGLLADSFNGGLRKDLTAAFENQPLYLKTFGDGVSGGSNAVKETQRKVYSVNAIGSGGGSGDWVGGATPISAINSNTSDVVFDGLRWDSLFLYYNLCKAKMPSPVTTASASGNIVPTGIGTQFADGVGGNSTCPTVPQRVYCEMDLANSESFTIDPILPVVAQWTFSPGYALALDPPTQTGPGSHTYDIVFYNSPQAVLYNPWDVQIGQAPGYASKVGIRATVGSHFYFTSTGDPTTYIIAVYGDSGLATDPSTITKNNPPLMPGELRVYGVANDTDLGPEPYNAPVSSQYTVPYSVSANSSLAVGNLVTPSCPKPSVDLVSNFTVDNYITCEVQAMIKADISKAVPDTLSIYGVQTAAWYHETINHFNVWPITTPTGGEIYSPSAPVFYPLGKTPVSSGLPINPVTSPFSTGGTPLLAFVDRLSGYNSASASMTYSKAGPGIATPGFAAGGSIYNPLNNQVNGMMRDYGNVGLMTSTPAYSQAYNQNSNLSLHSLPPAGSPIQWVERWQE